MSNYPIRLPASNPLVTVTRRTTELQVPNLSIANDHPFLATPNAWIIELHNGADSRLSTELITGGLLPALDIVERDWRNVWRAARAAKDKTGGRGSLILVGNRSQDKFFSNGMYSDIALRCITKFNVIRSPDRNGL